MPDDRQTICVAAEQLAEIPDEVLYWAIQNPEKLPYLYAPWEQLLDEMTRRVLIRQAQVQARRLVP